ncbi:MAG TPA: hypothetical protein VF519_10345 [Mycobacteriales bacterium]|jgi:hypothetical protein
MKRTLSLRREPLAALTDEDLAAVAAGAIPTTPVEECLYGSRYVCTWDCMTRGTTCAC